MAEVVDRALRDFVRYTGDGLPNEPVGHPAPIGDPASGIHNPRKKDMRDALNSIIGLAEASTGALSDLAGYALRASEPPHADFKVQRDGLWYSPPPLLVVWLDQSNGLGNDAATTGVKTGISPGNVLAYNGTTLVQAALGALPFNTAPGLVNNSLFHACHKLAKERQRPVVGILHAVPGSGIGTWVPPTDAEPSLGANWIAANAKANAALAQIQAIWPEVTGADVVFMGQGANEYDLAPISTLSQVRYPQFIGAVKAAPWFKRGGQIIFCEDVTQADGGTAFRANAEKAKIVDSGLYPGVYLSTAAGLKLTGADVGQQVHFGGADLVERGYRGADMYLNASAGVTSAAVDVAADAIGALVWKGRLFGHVCDLTVDPSDTSAQPLTIGTTIAGVPVVFEVDGVRTEVVSAGGMAAVLNLSQATPANVRIFAPADHARDQGYQFSCNMGAGLGRITSLWNNPLGGLSQVFLAGHEQLRHSVEPKSWPRPDPNNPVVANRGLKTYRINGSPLVTFDRFEAQDIPSTLTYMTFTGTTPVPQQIRDAITAESARRVTAIVTEFGAAFVPYLTREVNAAMFGFSATFGTAASNAAALTAAITYAAGRKVIIDVPVDWLCASMTTTSQHVDVEFVGPGRRDSTTTGLWTIGNAYDNIQAVSALTTVNIAIQGVTSRATAMAVANGAAYAVGDVMRIVSDDVDPDCRVGYSARFGEDFVISHISGNTIYATGRLEFFSNYVTNIRVARLPKYKVSVKGLKVKGGRTNGGLLYVGPHYRPDVEIEYNGAASGPFTAYGCIEGKFSVDGDFVLTGDYNDLLYGGLDRNGARNTWKIKARRARHAFTTGYNTVTAGSTDIYEFGPTRDALVIDGFATDCANADWDDHEGARRTRFVRCSSQQTTLGSGGQTKAYQFRGRDTVVQDMLVGAGYDAALVTTPWAKGCNIVRGGETRSPLHKPDAEDATLRADLDLIGVDVRCGPNIGYANALAFSTCNQKVRIDGGRYESWIEGDNRRFAQLIGGRVEFINEPHFITRSIVGGAGWRFANVLGGVRVVGSFKLDLGHTSTGGTMRMMYADTDAVSVNYEVTQVAGAVLPTPAYAQGAGSYTEATWVQHDDRGSVRQSVSSILTVANLPAASTNRGRFLLVLDANATTFNSVVAGGGSNILWVRSNGTDWRISG
ncbi:hypothetical protein GCM10010873_26530 [Cypionkella aquatica]|uniref:Uncharacterized protein n=1 Tax=Cypionkella aquatica TaxID=1756042 RepID=A0AA37X239_9RHOB|nr:hypothetical protein [Cypionkella aquatica]GLS87679.1 hypothetical protein GCM10010873_26530 [Cypionkella aquatica]